MGSDTPNPLFSGPSWKVIFSYVYDDERGRQKAYDFRFYADDLDQCLQRIHRVVKTRFSVPRQDSEDYLDIFIYDWDGLLLPTRQMIANGFDGPVEHLRYEARELAIFWNEQAKQLHELKASRVVKL